MMQKGEVDCVKALGCARLLTLGPCTHQLDMRRPGRPSKRPTGEVSKPGRSKPLFNLRHKFAFYGDYPSQ
jgi:hypothetical protein